MRILSLAPLAGPALDALKSMGDLTVDSWLDHVPVKLHSAPELIERCKNIDVLIVEADHVGGDVLDATSLAALGVARGDPNNVDVEAATRNGVAVLRAPGRNARGVAELALALTLALLRDVRQADDDVRHARFVVDGKLAQQRYKGREIRSVTVGIVGFGAVGREAARLFAMLGARVIVHDPFARSDDYDNVSLEQLMERADVVSIHAPLTPETKGMIGERHLASMKPGAVLVNTARFGIVDEPPLLEALRTHALRAAAFDHFTGEFLPPEHPLLALPNVILTPHIGGTTGETIEEHTRLIADGLALLAKGETPANLVNPETAKTASEQLRSRA